jgi:hypothetical protein
MRVVRVLAGAARTPGIDVKTLTTRQPPLSELLWSSGDKSECFASASCARSLEPSFSQPLFMGLEKMATEAA